MVKYYRKKSFRKRRAFRRRPMRKMYRRRAPRRSFRRRFRRSRPATRQPYRKLVTFRYVNLLDANLGVDEVFARHYNITDPGAPIDTTHQALGWQNAIREYKFWRVKGVKVTMKNNNDQSNQVIDSVWSMFFDRYETNYNFDDISTRFENFGVNNRKMLRIGRTDLKGQSRVAYWSARKWYGPITVTDADYWGSGDNAPIEACYLNVHGGPAIENGDPGMAHLLIQIEYIVEFREPYLDEVRDQDIPALLAKKQVALPDVTLGEIEQGGLQEEIQ